MSELKACPFCGGEARKYPYSDKGSHAWMVSCDKSTHRALLSDWNTRPLEDALQAKLDETVEFLNRLSHWDMLWCGEGQPHLVADGAFWKRQIDEALAKLESK